MNLVIEYENTQNNKTLTLEYRLRDNAFVDKWVERVQTAQQLYAIDNPTRFYGFGSYESQVEDALKRINHCVTVINLYNPVINRTLTDIQDQDTLNYLHHMFELYHGLLDAQIDPFWSNAPIAVKQALAELNISVHRCESIARGAEPRHVVTYYGLPKDHVLSTSDYEYFTDTWNAGTVLLNYCEIGKTIMDLAEDHDLYINDGAFQPFRHYSADFVVRFSPRTQEEANRRYAIMYAYYKQHREFFGDWQPCYINGSIPLADLVGPLDLSVLEQYQSVKSVNFN